MNYKIDLDEIKQYETLHNQLNKSSFALIVIEMQEAFRSDELCLISNQQINNVNKLISFSKTNSKKPYIIRHNDSNAKYKNMLNWWGTEIEYNSKEWQIIPELDIDNSIIIDKNQYSAFFQTELEEHLRKENITDILICGNMTNCCCDTTARDAFMRGFNVFFINDATATINAELHLAAIKNLAFGFATILNTNEVIK